MKSWRTTILGAAALLLAGVQIAGNPAKLADEATLASIAAGVGLILAQDHRKPEKHQMYPPPR